MDPKKSNSILLFPLKECEGLRKKKQQKHLLPLRLIYEFGLCINCLIF